MSASPPTAPLQAFAKLQAAQNRDGALPLARRRELLTRLEQSLVARREEIVRAIDADYGGRAAEETLLSEVLMVVGAIRHARPRLRRWARPRRVGVGMAFWPARAWVVPQPLGIVGILSPWNYPVQLALAPLISAIAAGNRVALKPSETTPRTSELLRDLTTQALGEDVVQTVLGGPEVAAGFTRAPFDHLLFTGSTETGRRVMRTAAETLTPLTLELGGKCPALVMPDADLARAARAIVSGKGLNAGQSCIAPDTVLLVGHAYEAFREAAAKAYAELFPTGLRTSLASPAQADRLARLGEGASLEPLGRGAVSLSLAPSPDPASPLLAEEIFGPILPIVRVPTLDEALAWVAQRPTPLAVYLFTRSRGTEARVLESTRSGALVVNGTIVQAAIEGLPFGGVGASGFGRYHGRAGFETFSNPRAYVRAARYNLAWLTDRPPSPKVRKLIDRLISGR